MNDFQDPPSQVPCCASLNQVAQDLSLQGPRVNQPTVAARNVHYLHRVHLWQTSVIDPYLYRERILIVNVDIGVHEVSVFEVSSL